MADTEKDDAALIVRLDESSTDTKVRLLTSLCLDQRQALRKLEARVATLGAAKEQKPDDLLKSRLTALEGTVAAIVRDVAVFGGLAPFELDALLPVQGPLGMVHVHCRVLCSPEEVANPPPAPEPAHEAKSAA